MTIFNMTDLHGSTRYLEELRGVIADADLVVLSGDVTNFGGFGEARRVIDAVTAVNPRVFAVPGNCDRKGVGDLLRERGIDLHAAAREVGGVAFVGLGGSLPGPAPTPTTFGERELKELLAAVELPKEGPLVLVSHQPPLDSPADVIASGMHVGSRAVRSFIERTRPSVCLTGHIHESIGEGELFGCRVVNPGPFGSGRYALVEIHPDGNTRVELCRVSDDSG